MPAAKGRAATSIPVVLEMGTKRVFASALDWPGWCRAAKDETAALAALASYAPRFSVVTRAAGLKLPARAGDASSFEVVERVGGSATTDFGAPGAVAEAERADMTRQEAIRRASLVEGAWTVWDSVVKGAPETLRKGPRGGGRDRDAVVDHVLAAEAAYAAKLGVRLRGHVSRDPVVVAAHRHDMLEALRAPSDGSAVGAKGWPPRYVARRIAWHVVDHAWEIEDKSI